MILGGLTTLYSFSLVTWELRREATGFSFLFFPVLLTSLGFLLSFFSLKLPSLGGDSELHLVWSRWFRHRHDASFALSPFTAQAVGPGYWWHLGCLCHPSAVTDIILFWSVTGWGKRSTAAGGRCWCFIVIGPCSTITRMMTPKKRRELPHSSHCISWTGCGAYIVFNLSWVGEIQGHKHREWF